MGSILGESLTTRHGNTFGIYCEHSYAIFRRHVGQFRFIVSQVSTQLLWKTCAHGRRLKTKNHVMHCPVSRFRGPSLTHRTQTAA